MFTLKIDTDQPNGIFENGQYIQPFVLIDNHSDKSLTGQLMWRVTTDTGAFLEETTVTVTLPPGSSRRDYSLEADRLSVGFYRLESQFQYRQQVDDHNLRLKRFYYWPASYDRSLLAN